MPKSNFKKKQKTPCFTLILLVPSPPSLRQSICRDAGTDAREVPETACGRFIPIKGQDHDKNRYNLLLCQKSSLRKNVVVVFSNLLLRSSRAA